MAPYEFTNEGRPGSQRGRCHPAAAGGRHPLAGHPLANPDHPAHAYAVAALRGEGPGRRGAAFAGGEHGESRGGPCAGPGGRHGGGPRGGRGRFDGGPFDHSDRHGGFGGPGGFGPGGPWGPGPGGPWGGRGPGRRGGPGGRRGRGPRASRGDIRAGILVLLGEQPMHGYQIMRELSERSGGVWRPSPGSVYPQLSQLQDEGLVSGEEKSGGRRLFSLTDDGKVELESRKDEKAPWEAVSEEESVPAFELRGVVFQVGAAAHQVLTAGTDEQVNRAIAVLKDTRRALYRILAEDEPEPEASGDADGPVS